jgi:hypothetical protein
MVSPPALSSVEDSATELSKEFSAELSLGAGAASPQEASKRTVVRSKRRMRFMVLSFLFWHLPFFLFEADFAGEAPKSVPKTIRFRAVFYTFRSPLCGRSS